MENMLCHTEKGKKWDFEDGGNNPSGNSFRCFSSASIQCGGKSRKETCTDVGH